MYSRVTLLEIDTVRVDVDAAAALFEEHVVPGLRDQDGYEGSVVLATAEGKGMIITLWATEESALAAAAFATGALEEFVTLFKAPPGRDYYEVKYLDLAHATAGI